MADIIDTVNEDFQNGQTILRGKRVGVLLARAFELREEINDLTVKLTVSKNSQGYLFERAQKAEKVVAKSNVHIVLLREALCNLLDACDRADNDGDLSGFIDGSLLEIGRDALKQTGDK